jgi:hypothetical protein
MSSPALPPRAKLFIGIIANSDELVSRAEKVLIKKYGPIDFRSMKIPFTHTDYYKSIGTNLYKTFFSFEKLVRRERIVDIKLFTNRLEEKISKSEKRKINIDPGYLTLSNVYLASCKEYFHRTYLAKGIYLENEYRYVAKQFEFWDWTYPDYRKHEYLSFFYNVRKIYHNQIR